MALDLPLPKKVFGHPWLLVGNDKMSKSKGNIIYADDLVKEYGVDAIRYYFLHEIPFANDGTYTDELLVERYNSDLANNLGNLVNRTISMTQKYFDGVVPEVGIKEDVDNELINTCLNAYDLVNSKMDELKVADAIDVVFGIFKRANKYIDETMPWVLAKEGNTDRLKTVIYNLLESIRIGTVLLQPFLPETADKIFSQLNTENKSFESIKEFNGLDTDIKLNNPEPLFVRIDKNK